MFEIKTEVKVEDSRAQDLLCCALEGGSNYWYYIKEKRYPAGQTKESLGIEFPHLELPFKGGSLVIDAIDEVPVGELSNKVLDRSAIQLGLQLLAEEYPMLWSDFMNENEDAVTGDVFLQLALFGEVIFA